MKYVVDEIHTVIVATVDSKGLSVITTIDMIDIDENDLLGCCSGKKVKNGEKYKTRRKIKLPFTKIYS